MKSVRLSRFASVAALAALVISACATSSHVNTREIPSWYLNPPTSKTVFYGTGSAKEQSLELSRSLAVAIARSVVAQDVRIVVKTGITRYLQQAGSGKDQQALNFGDEVTRQVSKVALSGCSVEKVVVTNNGRVYALVSYPVTTMNDSAKQAFTRDQAAAFAQFQSDQAVKAMDDELAHNPPKAAAPKP